MSTCPPKDKLGHDIIRLAWLTKNVHKMKVDIDHGPCFKFFSNDEHDHWSPELMSLVDGMIDKDIWD